MRHRTRMPHLLVLALALAAVLLAGCGDGDSTGEPPSKQEFISKADQICEQGDAEIDAEGQEFAGRADVVEELTRTVIVPGYRDQLAQLRELTPPEGDEAEIKKFLGTFERGVDQLDASPRQLAGGRAIRTIIDARRLARSYGMGSCSRGS